MLCLCGIYSAPDGFRAHTRQHSIESSAADGDFCLLRSEQARPQPVSDHRLITTDRGLDQGSLAVVGSSLPFHPPIGVDRRDMTVSLTGKIGVWPFRRVGAWRNDHRSTRAMLGDGVISWVAVISPISRELADGVVDLVEAAPPPAWRRRHPGRS